MRIKLKKLIEKSFNRETYIIEYTSLLITLLIFVTFGLLFISEHVGFTTAGPGIHNASAGYITEIEMIHERPTFMWAGVYGIAMRFPGYLDQEKVENLAAGDITRANIYFNCIQDDAPGGKRIFATTATNISFNTLFAATPDMIDEFLNWTGTNKSDSANNTFTDNITVYIGTTPLTNVPATYTFKLDAESTDFDVGVLNDSENLVFATHIYTGGTGLSQGYSPNVSVNYQMLLPVPENTTQTYYFFSDPNDQCPAGGIGEAINATVYGYVTDVNNDSIEAAAITIAGYSELTDASGFYNITYQVIPGNYTIIAVKQGYNLFFDTVKVTFSNYTEEKNITLLAETLGKNETVTPLIDGYVRNAAGAALSDANVSIDGVTNVSGSDGYYSLQPTLSLGKHYIVAIKTDYDNYVGNITAESNTTYISHNITMTTANPYATGPYATGPYTTEAVEEITYPPVPQVIERPEGVEVFIPIKDIKKKVLHNTFIEEEVPIFNFKGSSITMNFALTDSLKSVIALDKTSITVASDSWGSVILTIYGNELGEYNGTLKITGDVEQDIPVTIRVVENKFPVELLLMRLELLDNIVTPGSSLDYKVSLQNLLSDQRYKVDLNYIITDANNSEIYVEEEEQIEIHTTANLLKKFLLPKDMEPSDYVLRVNAKYMGLTSTISTKFRVSKPLYLYTAFGIPLWIIMLLISLLSSGTFSYSLYKRYLESKKRYRLVVNFKELPRAGPRAAYVGQIAETDVKTYIDLDKLTTHTIVAGATGRGKTIAAQDIIEEALMKGVGVLVVDPTAQWSGMLRKCKDKKMLSFYPKFGMKPEDARPFNGNVKQITNAREIIEIKKQLKPGEINILAVNLLDPKDVDIFVANTIREIFHSDPKEQRELKFLMVYDEVHRLLPKFGGSGEGFIQVERACREFRKWGIGLILISQVLSDFVGAVKANINTEIQTRTIDENDLERIKTKFGGEVLKSLVKADVGVAMVQNAEYNKGKPYFVNFRPILHSVRRLDDKELENYNKYNAVIDDLEYQIDQLEKEGVDVFDLKLELKLALDKVKSGNFNMVDIYLEGLSPRVESHWSKLGKKPKKRVVKLIDEDILKKSLEEAKAARAKYEAEHKEEEKKEEVKKENPFEKVVKAFTFDNGMMISSLKELKEVFEVMDDELFKFHVNEGKNDIADWVKSVGFKELGDKLAKIKDKDEMFKVLVEAQKEMSGEGKKKEGEESEEEKPEEDKKKPEKEPEKPSEEKKAEEKPEKKKKEEKPVEEPKKSEKKGE